MRLRLVPQDTNWDFFKYRFITSGLSVVAVVASLILWATVGLNFGIDFLGGTTIRTEASQPIDAEAYRKAVEELDLGEVSVIEISDPTFDEDQHVASVRIQAQDDQEAATADTVDAVLEALGSKFGGKLSVRARGGNLSSEAIDQALGELGLNANASIADGEGVTVEFGDGLPGGSFARIEDALVSSQAIDSVEFSYEEFAFLAVESVGPKVSGELIQTALLAIAAALAAILIYIWLRFEWQFSIGAVAALFHDVILTIGIFSLLQLRFELATVAAILTIVGYSINDTVVIFDRLRENLRKFKKTPLIEVMNKTVNETLSRTLMTSGTTLIALIALLIFGGDVIRGFVFAITWGVIVGTYSSVYIAKNVVLLLGVKRDWSKPEGGGGGAGTQFANVDA